MVFSGKVLKITDDLTVDALASSPGTLLSKKNSAMYEIITSLAFYISMVFSSFTIIRAVNWYGVNTLEIKTRFNFSVVFS